MKLRKVGNSVGATFPAEVLARLKVGAGDTLHLVETAWGLTRNHPFVDGNKRTSFGVCMTFLALNGADVTADDSTKVVTWLALAEGSLDEDKLATLLRSWRS